MTQSTVRKSAVKFTAIVAAGKSGCGKSALMDSFRALVDPDEDRNWIMRAEMSEILKWGKSLQTELGQKIRDSQNISDGGKFLPDSLIIELFPIWLNEHLPANHAEEVLLLGSGFPRTMPQEEMLGVFERSCVIHLLASDEVSHKSVIERFNKSPAGMRRSDDGGGEKVFREKLAEYNNLVVPCIKHMVEKKRNVLEINRGEITHCNQQIIHYLNSLGSSSPVSKRTLKLAKHRLRNNNHRVHGLFQKILNPRPSLMTVAAGATA